MARLCCFSLDGQSWHIGGTSQVTKEADPRPGGLQCPVDPSCGYQAHGWESQGRGSAGQWDESGRGHCWELPSLQGQQCA